jgi:hypothetical protein
MNKQTKTLLTIGGVAVLGYILYKQFGKKSFANASGRYSRTRLGTDEMYDCPKCNKQGKCWSIIPTTDATIASGIAGMKAITDCTPTETTTSV